MIHSNDLTIAPRIPASQHGRLLYLKSEDHYIRVCTDKGTALIFGRLSDVIAILDKKHGRQVHRSWWVAQAAVIRAIRKNGKTFLELSNGHIVPVSRARAKELRSAGWLNNPGEPRNSHKSPRSWWHWVPRPTQLIPTAIAVIALLIGGLALYDSTNLRTEMASTSPAERAFAAGWQDYLLDTPQSLKRASGHFQKAVGYDDQYGKAYGAMASLYHSAATRGWSTYLGLTPHEVYRRAHANLILADKHPTAIGYAAEAQALLYRHRVEDAMAMAARALALEPHDPSGHIWMANALIMAGLPVVATGFLDHAEQLGHPGSPTTLYFRGLAAFTEKDYAEAARYFEQAFDQSPEMSPVSLISAYGLLGEIEKAQNVISAERAKRTPINPLNITTAMDGMVFDKKQHAQQYVRGLRLAGL